MRAPPLPLLLLAACGAPSASREGLAPLPEGRPVRVVFDQYRGPVFIVENLAGRDLVALRSRRLGPGETAVAYVPDDVMAEMLEHLERFDFHEYARPRPPDPRALGASGEVTVTDASGRRRSFLRIKAPEGVALSREKVKAAKAFAGCRDTVCAVWSAYPPRMQATASRGAFGRPRNE